MQFSKVIGIAMPATQRTRILGAVYEISTQCQVRHHNIMGMIPTSIKQVILRLLKRIYIYIYIYIRLRSLIYINGLTRSALRSLASSQWWWLCNARLSLSSVHISAISSANQSANPPMYGLIRWSNITWVELKYNPVSKYRIKGSHWSDALY